MRRVRDKTDLPEYDPAFRHFFERAISETEFQLYIASAISELEAYMQPLSTETAGKLMFLSKYIFSALIDADRTNTDALRRTSLPSRN